MSLLVSLCNLGSHRRRLPGDVAVLHVDPDSRSCLPVALVADAGQPMEGITGLCKHRDGYLAAVQPNILLWLSARLEMLRREVLATASCVHSVQCHDGAAYVVSTGNDCVERIGDSGQRDVVWMASDRGADTVHLNSILWHAGECYVSGFGPKKSELWRSASDGFVRNITRDVAVMRGVYHPHSVTSIDGQIWVCESARSALLSERGVRVATPWGYLRGLCRQGDYLYVGSSVGRNKSKSTGVLIDNVADPGELSGPCGIGVLRYGDRPSIVDFIELSEYASEVYDIVPMG